jgi:hypothetical protein
LNTQRMSNAFLWFSGLGCEWQRVTEHINPGQSNIESC